MSEFKTKQKWTVMILAGLLSVSCGSGKPDADIQTGPLHTMPVNSECNDNWDTPLRTLVGTYQGSLRVLGQNGQYASQAYSLKFSQCKADIVDAYGQRTSRIFLHANVTAQGAGPLGHINVSAFLGLTGSDEFYRVFHSHPITPNPFKQTPIAFMVLDPINKVGPHTVPVIRIADCQQDADFYSDDLNLSCEQLSQTVQFNDDLVRR